MLRHAIAILCTVLATAPTFASSESKTTSKSDSDESSLVCTKGVNNKLYCKPNTSDEIQLTSKNLLVLRGVIDAKSASNFIRQFNELEQRSDVDTIYVWVRSPGGSVFAGEYMTNVISSSKKQVVMIVDFAASMAFYVTQFGTTRVMIPSGTLMQHHPSGGPSAGEFPNVDSQWDWLKRKITQMRKKEAAACSKTTYEQFSKNVDRDWWLLASEAEAAGCVDRVTPKIYCSKDLSNSTTVEYVSFFGMEVQVVWSGCPYELYPREVKVPERSRTGVRMELSQDQLKYVDNYIQLSADPMTYFQVNGSFQLKMPPTSGEAEKTTPTEIKMNENSSPRPL